MYPDKKVCVQLRILVAFLFHLVKLHRLWDLKGSMGELDSHFPLLPGDVNITKLCYRIHEIICTWRGAEQMPAVT